MRKRSYSLAPVAVVIAVAAFVAVAAGASSGVEVSIPWAPTLGLRLDIAIDGLAILYGLLATGIGGLVFVYGSAYLPLHLGHESRPAREATRFWVWIVVFMLAMVGLATARDLILLFLFFDVTAVASYFLIGFDRERIEARGAALMALTVTGVSAVGLLAGAALLHAEYGTFSIPTLSGLIEAGGTTTLALVLITFAAMAKSAQVPLHFWLPRAMAAPTPVSAYLHSAAMVAAGVLVLGRVHPMLTADPTVLSLLVVVGLASIAIGGILALAQEELKQILAHSTISQYGYVVVLYGIGGPAGAGAAAFYVVAHAIAKSALFMTAGAVTEATGESRLSHLGGLARSMPALAVVSGIAAATLAAVPLTIGFFKDELFFTAAIGAGSAMAALAVVAAGLTFAYIGRFWLGIFAGSRGASPDIARQPVLFVLPIAILAAIALAGGIVVEPFARLAAGAAATTHGSPVDVAPAYHLDARPENVMAALAWVLGGSVLAATRLRVLVVGAVARLGDRLGPRHWYGVTLDLMHAASHRLHGAEVRDLRTSLAAVVIPTGTLMALGFAVTPTDDTYVVGPVAADDLPIVVLLGLVVVAAIRVAMDRGRLRAVLALSVLGFGLAALYAVAGAPDVALVAVLIETMLTIVFVAIFSRLPPSSAQTSMASVQGHRHGRHITMGVLAGLSAFAAIWAALSREPLGSSDAAEHIRLTPQAHGGDVVTVILADFRGLDTMVEITVLTVALVGAAGLLRRGRLW